MSTKLGGDGGRGARKRAPAQLPDAVVLKEKLRTQHAWQTKKNYLAQGKTVNAL